MTISATIIIHRPDHPCADEDGMVAITVTADTGGQAGDEWGLDLHLGPQPVVGSGRHVYGGLSSDEEREAREAIVEAWERSAA